MNLFLLDWCFEMCAKYHFDSHVVKMILELAQLLSTAHHVLGKDKTLLENWQANKKLYRATHVNHPCELWVRKHINNYRFTAALAKALCAEYTFRYGKVHATESIIDHLQRHEPPIVCCETETLVGPHQVTEPAQAMPDQCKVTGDAISAYRRYYCSSSKDHLRRWKKRTEPEWVTNTQRLEIVEKKDVKKRKRT